MSLPEVHLIGASRAEALRLAPVAIAIRAQGWLTPVLLATGPDPSAVDRTFAAFGLTPQVTIPTGHEPAEAIRRLDALWAGRTPGAIILRDCAAAAAAAFWRRIPILQVDAGRRFGDLTAAAPGGAEAERRMLTQFATVHLAATPLAAMNLLDERVAAGDVLLTGSTVADATRVLAERRGSVSGRSGRAVLISSSEERGKALGRALRGLTARFPDLAVVVLTGP